jgi:acetylornithine deacetylase/succinyl-diaminopimelate desuccinylase-like protein/gamma-glutamyl:cysteine ligase YbdK (ATP-grasp superfamily)
MYDPALFAEKYQLAVQAAIESKPHGGLCGFELEWNLLDSLFRPLLTVGSGPGQQSFVDFLRAECLSPWLREFSQLEVFHWMIEWATRPYYQPRGAIFEARLMEAVLVNALQKAGRPFDQRIYTWPGNLPILTQVNHDSIPGSWHLAKRLYLQRCVDLYGDSLATAGTHANLSLPEPLFTWDFMHLPQTERMGSRSAAIYLDDYKSQFYITAARLMRAFACLFVATSAATPFQAQVRDGHSVVMLSENDSVRNLTFPNPSALDVPDLYRSYEDYLRISYDLVQRGVRFGNNNWTPTRARSFAEPVERLIAVTSDQLNELYARGLYVLGQETQMEEMAQQIEMQNLMARINLPMARVEVRTDDGGHPLEVDIANLTLKYLLMLRFYADGEFARAFRYDREDIARARSNEEVSARQGLRGEIEHPLTAKPVKMREFLRWTLNEIRPLAEALGVWEDLTPMIEMAEGAPNTAERLRACVLAMLGKGSTEAVEAPLEILQELAHEREVQVAADIEMIAAFALSNPADTNRLNEFIQHAREEARLSPQAAIRFRPRPEAVIEISYPDKTSEILDLAQQLICIPSVTACPTERLEEVHRAATLIFDYARSHGMGVRYYDQEKYPALLLGLPDQMHAPVMLAGHFDVVEPEPDDSQFTPRIEGDYLWGRGAADMKTVVATYLVWLKDTFRQGAPYPPINLLLVGNEENGEAEPMGTPHLLRLLAEEEAYTPRLLIAGERTGEGGDELWGEICTQNRGVVRFEATARGQRGHTGIAAAKIPSPGKSVLVADLTERLLLARAGIIGILGRFLTLSDPGGWQSQVKFPYIQVGTPGVYNITADLGLMGAEIRPIPQDDLEAMRDELQAYCKSLDLELNFSVFEGGIVCAPDNLYLVHLIAAVKKASGLDPNIGRKLPGTSARFAPAGQGVVWGQTGIGPHSKNERHFIPSILPYSRALEEYGKLLVDKM